MLLEDRQAAVKRTPPHQTLLSLGDAGVVPGLDAAGVGAWRWWVSHMGTAGCRTEHTRKLSQLTVHRVLCCSAAGENCMLMLQ
jgi:hypothetical protein